MNRLLIALLFMLPFIGFGQFEQGDSVYTILDGRYLVFKSNTGHYGIKRNDNTVIVQPQYVHITEIEEGIIIVKQNKNTSYERSYSSGFLNKQLKMILPCNYRNIYSSGNHMLIACQNTDTKYGLVDTLGRIRIPFQYDDIGYYGDGMFPVKQGQLYGYMNENGKTIIPFTFAFAHSFSEGLAAAATEKGVYGYIDKRGHFAIPDGFVAAGPFHYRYAMVNMLEMASIIDDNGNVLFPYLFQEIECVAPGLFLFKAPEALRDTFSTIVAKDNNWLKNSSFSFSNPDKTIESEELLPFDFVVDTDFQGVINEDGQLIGGNGFKSVQFLGMKNDDAFFAVQSKSEIDQNDNWNFAVMDQNGKIITPYDFFEIRFEDEMIIGYKEIDLKNTRYKIEASGKTTKL